MVLRLETSPEQLIKAQTELFNYVKQDLLNAQEELSKLKKQNTITREEYLAYASFQQRIESKLMRYTLFKFTSFLEVTGIHHMAYHDKDINPYFKENPKVYKVLRLFIKQQDEPLILDIGINHEFLPPLIYNSIENNCVGNAKEQTKDKNHNLFKKKTAWMNPQNWLLRNYKNPSVQYCLTDDIFQGTWSKAEVLHGEQDHPVYRELLKFLNKTLSIYGLGLTHDEQSKILEIEAFSYEQASVIGVIQELMTFHSTKIQIEDKTNGKVTYDDIILKDYDRAITYFQSWQSSEKQQNLTKYSNPEYLTIQKIENLDYLFLYPKVETYRRHEIYSFLYIKYNQDELVLPPSIKQKQLSDADPYTLVFKGVTPDRAQISLTYMMLNEQILPKQIETVGSSYFQ